MTAAADLIAKPGDPDLDCDLDGLTVTSVVTTDDCELLIRLTGGAGTFPDGPVHDGSADLRAWFPDTPPDLFAAFVARLQRWRDTAARMRMCAAPGRLTLLLNEAGDFVPWPRRTHPDWTR